MNSIVTGFASITSKEPQNKPLSYWLERIKNGKSKKSVEAIRAETDKEKKQKLKMKLPSICFSGEFGPDRKDEQLIKHSGFMVLDFDDVADIDTLKHELRQKEYIAAIWISPSGTGVKALVSIADPSKHREHFDALRDIFPLIDKSGVNVSRVCYESYDPDILIKSEWKPFAKIKVQTITRTKEKVVESDDSKTFDKIKKWLDKRGDAFTKGERNLYIYKLASACCRFGLAQSETERFINNDILVYDSTFTTQEALQTIGSAYKNNKSGTACFENDELVDRVNKKTIEIDSATYDLNVRPKDVIFGEDVKADAMRIYDYGYESATSTEIPELDIYWKWKRGEITLISGIGNYGKSSFLKFILLMKSIKQGWKWALFAPEDFPAYEFYHDITEMMIGMSLAPTNLDRPKKAKYEAIYDWVCCHFFFVYPEGVKSTPDYIKERFLEMIIKEKVNGLVIDPFNQLDNDYSGSGGRDDKYLEILLADLKRFTQTNNTHLIIVAHPKGGIKKLADGNYECPDVFDLAGGAMWNNKMDNILIYHRPYRGSEPTATNCQIHTKKIKRQRVVGIIGVLNFHLKKDSRRFLFGDQLNDYIADHYRRKPEQKELDWEPPTDDKPF